MPLPNDATILVHLEYIRQAIDRVAERLDVQNSRLRTAETSIAVLEDRANDVTRTSRNWGAGVGIAGGFMGGFVSAFIEKWLR